MENYNLASRLISCSDRRKPALDSIGAQIAGKVGLPLIGMSAADFATIVGDLINDARTIAIRKEQGRHGDRERTAHEIEKSARSLREAIETYRQSWGQCELTSGFVSSLRALRRIEFDFRREGQDAGVASILARGLATLVRGPMSAAFRGAFGMNAREGIKHDRVNELHHGPFICFAQEIFGAAGLSYEPSSIAKALSRRGK